MKGGALKRLVLGCPRPRAALRPGPVGSSHARAAPAKGTLLPGTMEGGGVTVPSVPRPASLCEGVSDPWEAAAVPITSPEAAGPQTCDPCAPAEVCTCLTGPRPCSPRTASALPALAQRSGVKPVRDRPRERVSQGMVLVAEARSGLSVACGLEDTTGGNL